MGGNVLFLENFRTHPRQGSRRDPAKRSWWEAEEQGSGRSFRRQAETELSVLCDDADGGKCFVLGKFSTPSATGLPPGHDGKEHKTQQPGPFGPGCCCTIKQTILWNGLFVVYGVHVGDQLHHLVGVAALVVLSLSAKDPFKHLKTRYLRYNSHIIWDKVYSQDISQILSCFL